MKSYHISLSNLSSIEDVCLAEYLYNNLNPIISVSRFIALDAPVLYIVGDQSVTNNQWVYQDKLEGIKLRRSIGFPNGRWMLVDKALSIGVVTPFNDRLDNIYRRSLFGGIAKAFREYGINLHKTKLQESQYELCLDNEKKLVSEGLAYNHKNNTTHIEALINIKYPMDIAKRIYKPIKYESGTYNIEDRIIDLESLGVKYEDKLLDDIISNFYKNIGVEWEYKELFFDYMMYKKVNNDSNWILNGKRN